MFILIVAPPAGAGTSFWDGAFMLMVPSNLLSFHMLLLHPARAGSERYGETVVTGMTSKSHKSLVFLN